MVPIVLLLAAGQSSRMGCPKGLLDYFGEPWLLEQMRRIEKIKALEIALVLGYHEKEYRERIPEIERRMNELKLNLKLSLVTNPDPDRGTFSSIITGLSFLRNTYDSAIFLLPIDVPCPEISTWSAIAQRYSNDIDVGVPTYQERGGHPVLLSPHFIDHLLTLSLSSPQARLDYQIRQIPEERKSRIPVSDPQVTFNLNSPEDWLEFVYKSNCRKT